MNPKVSILIANYNNGKYFNDCWNSIIAQTYKNLEIVIVDDCSTDNSVSLIKDCVKDAPNVILKTNSQNKGCGYTKRECASLANGDLFAFVDPDDAIVGNAIETIVEIFRNNSKLALVYSNFTKYDQDLKEELSTRKFVKVNSSKIDFFNKDAEISHLCVFSKEVYKQTEGIDAYMLRAVDQDLYLKIYELGEVFGIDKVLYKYRFHKGGISQGKSNGSQKAKFWQWYAILNAAKRRGYYLEDDFQNEFVSKQLFEELRERYLTILNSRSFKISQKLLKWIK